jgi:hypothetical protein
MVPKILHKQLGNAPSETHGLKPLAAEPWILLVQAIIKVVELDESSIKELNSKVLSAEIADQARPLIIYYAKSASTPR